MKALAYFVCTVPLSFAALTAAHAQTAPVALDEIVVTAEKRAGDVQKTPIAITAISGADLAQANVSKPADLVNLVPGLAVSRGFGGLNNIYVRGIGAQIINAFGDMAVAQSVDGVYIARGTALSGAFLDVQRIEVLKGPQGTLYGRNSTGGAINYISNRPISGYAAGADLQLGNYGDREFKSYLNLPVGESLALRAAFGVIEHDGYIDRTDMDDQKTTAVRLSGLYKPNDRVSLLVTADYSQDRGKGVGQVVLNTAAGSATAITGDPWSGPPVGNYAPANYDGTLQSPGVNCTLLPGANQCRPPNTVTYSPNAYGPGVAGYLQNPDAVGRWAPGAHINNDNWGFMAQLDWDLGPATLTLVPAFRHTLARWVNPAGGYMTLIDTPADQTTFEARLSSNGDGPLKWLVGAFYFNEDQSPFERYWNFNQVPGGLITNQGYIRRDYELSDESYAAFGQVTYAVTDTLRVTGGLRYTSEEKTIGGLFRIGQPAYSDIGGTPFCPRGVSGTTYNIATSECVVPAGDKASWEATNWRLGVEYDVAPGSMVYANVSTGFHAGGFNDGFDSPPDAFPYKNTYEPEDIVAYAVGSKNRFLENRLQVNAEVFYWQFDKKQSGALSVLYPPVVGLPILNVGDLTEYGVDLDVSFLATRDDLLSVSVAYLNSEYDHYVFTPTSQVDCGAPIGENPILHLAIRDCAGKSIPNAPEWNATISYEHTFRLAGGAEVVAGARSHMQTESDLTIGAPKFARQEAYAITDLWLSYRGAEDRWNIGAYVNNVTETEAYNNAQQSFNSLDGTWWGNILPPRTYGVRGGFRF